MKHILSEVWTPLVEASFRIKRASLCPTSLKERFSTSSAHFRKQLVFWKILRSIFCCGGERNFSDACQIAGVKPEIVSDKLDNVLRNQIEYSNTPEKKTVVHLIDYIIEKHHVFTRNELERINLLVEKVCSKHGNSHSELFDIQKDFQLLADELLDHLQKEEKVLFPYIKVLDAVVSTNLPIAEPHFKTVKNPVRMMMNEHDVAGDILKQIRQSSNNFALPKGACTSFQLLYLSLENLEKDLHRHIHLENNVLFPQAIELEIKCASRGSLPRKKTL